MTPRRLRVAIAVVATAGIALTSYLTATSLLDEQVLCPTTGCEVVLSSEYSHLFGIPLSAFGLLAFVAILATALHRRGALPGVVVALTGVGYAAYLVVVQALVIEAYCTLCLVSHALMAALAGLTTWRLLATPDV